MINCLFLTRHALHLTNREHHPLLLQLPSSTVGWAATVLQHSIFNCVFQVSQDLAATIASQCTGWNTSANHISTTIWQKVGRSWSRWSHNFFVIKYFVSSFYWLGTSISNLHMIYNKLNRWPVEMQLFTSELTDVVWSVTSFHKLLDNLKVSLINVVLLNYTFQLFCSSFSRTERNHCIVKY